MNSISSAAALWVIECVRRRGKPVRPLLELVGIDPTKLPPADHHIEAERYVELWERAVRLTADPTFPLECGAAFDVEALGVFGFLAISCETLGDAYVRTAAVRDLYNVGASWDLEQRGARLRLKWNAWPLKTGSPAMNVYQVTEMLSSTRQMTRKRLVPTRVAFTNGPPADVAPFAKVFGVVPQFHADFCGFEGVAGWLELAIHTRNARLRDYFEKQCAQVQAAFARDPPFSAQVRRRLTESMNGERLGMREIAKALAVTERTLQRRLTEEGTGFNALLDEVRREFAERYLARENLALAEVAWLTGFNDSSSFFKAFRRWTGATPGEWRARVG